MPHATPQRAAHRAPNDGGLTLLVRSAARATSNALNQARHLTPAATSSFLNQARHLTPAGSTPAGTGRPRHAAHATAPRSWSRRSNQGPTQPHSIPEMDNAPRLITEGLAGVILIALAALIGFLVLADEHRGRAAEAAVVPATDLIGSRSADPAPLSLQEVFPNRAEIRVPGAAGPYTIAMTHIDNECGTATVGAVGDLLVEHGCDQVVRAGMTAPYGGYQVTLGLFNLADAGGADEVDSRLRRLVETGDGSFAPMTTAGLPGDDSPTAQVGWHAEGHYLLYCLITGARGELIAGDDPAAARITAELVDTYLGESVLGARASRA